jgi:hypothetical protein
MADAETRKPSVAICIPSGENWKGATAFATLCLGINSAETLNLCPVNVRGTDTAHARNQMVRMVREQAVDWLLWIDADMVFPPDALLRLIAHDRDIVGADYRLRAPPYPKIGLAINPDDPAGPPRQLSPEDDAVTTGLVERAVLGLGLLLVRASVFTEEGPWFMRGWLAQNARSDNPDGFTTEDSFFCAYARHRGFKVWCDLDLSAEVLHVGEMMVPWALGGARARS